MRTEHTIPLFLWVAAAVVAHAIFGGGATEVGSVISERIDVATFARDVSKTARKGTKPTEMLVYSAEDEPEPEKEPEPKDEKDAEADKSEDPKEAPVVPKAPEPEKKKPEEKKLEEKKEPEKKPALTLTPPPPVLPPPPPPTTDRRVAIKQQVKPDQEDNPNARHIANQANKVEEETVARNTSSDRNDADPSPPRNHAGADKTPGDSDLEHSGRAEEAKGDAQAKESTQDRAARAEIAAKAASARSPQLNSTRFQEATKDVPERKASEGREAKKEIQAQADTLRSAEGKEGFAMGGPRPEQKAQKAQKRLPPLKRGRDSELLGYGSLGLTARGVNLNLSPTDAIEVIGQDKLAETRKAIREKRLAQHRGSFTNMGREKWKAATENYVAVAKLGNQTALNAARVPFADYLNEIHQRIHPVFAEGFLASLSSLPADHPLNRMDMATNVEIAIDPADGRIVKMGVTQSSGVTMFDYGALESIEKASPFGPAPSAILSSDGKVYLHWEFHREPDIACSNQNARPMILKLPPAPTPPAVTPPPVESESGERTGDVPAPKSPSG